MSDVADSPAQLQIERFLPSDLDALMEIENISFGAPWSRESYEELSQLESVEIWTAKRGEELVGYMLFQHVGEEMELHTIAVKPGLRRQGLGRILMEHMIAEARRAGVVRIFLQVRSSNGQAKALYETFGFRTVGIRRHYYRDDDEDALVMKWEVGKDPS